MSTEVIESRKRQQHDIPHEHVAVAAYFIWKAEGCPDGHDLAHWHAAIENIKRAKRNGRAIYTGASNTLVATKDCPRRVVLDANQASPIATSVREGSLSCKPNIVLPPLVWAEILLSPYGKERLAAIGKLDVYFGLNISEIFPLILPYLDADDIRGFPAIVPRESPEHQKKLDSLNVCSNEQLTEARNVKKDSHQLARKKIEQLRQKRRAFRDARSRKEELTVLPKLTGIKEAMDLYANGPDSVVGQDIVSEIQSRRVPSNESLFTAVMSNPQLLRFFRLRLCFDLGYAQMWSDPRLNVNLSENRNDIPDLTVALYARDGDAVATADKNLTRALRHIDVENSLRIDTWNELMVGFGDHENCKSR